MTERREGEKKENSKIGLVRVMTAPHEISVLFMMLKFEPLAPRQQHQDDAVKTERHPEMACEGHGSIWPGAVHMQCHSRHTAATRHLWAARKLTCCV